MPQDFPEERELIVIARPEAGLRATREGISSVEGADVISLADLLRPEDITLRPLFGVREEWLKARINSLAATTGTVVPDLSSHYIVEAPDERLDELAEHLRDERVVQAAYVKPPGEPPQLLRDLEPSAERPPVDTPDFTARQG